ncbi:MAG: hypothetical protein IJN68_03885 [Clostridia bacterium]|nr:hypothetical protein [Oscillospiraceae bacterium]MBQ7005550.1 hypothetical protein [Clostridia bacterium]
MKIAYRIITPILALGTIAIGIVMKLFHFAIGTASEQLSQLTDLLKMFNIKTTFEFSVVDIIKLLMGVDTSKESEVDIVAMIEPIFPQLIAFVVFFILALVMLLVVAVVSAATNKRKLVIGFCAGGLVLCFIAIIISNSAFAKIIGGEIALSDVVSAFSESTWAALAAAIITIKTATLSGGFYGIFGMYLLIIFWTIISHMLIKEPIQFTKKHRRKKPIKSVSAIFRR